ncbi:flavin reductase family protein [Arenicella xantha]|uniref:Flavin reductase (DIM6/NTAB) family NADH-FMN oxidoreductase RutF n=1 Tax=Arenicella xantha TaxID=644221 RepID=A0A395JFN1_9GAMM|nr:flavin reductase family protein [Arenicella xantha]RBP48613.1 flavin reductase (DIM6/NTAB) family NADH-FMN oxidoreductase RutF [Arenicella xantha]
MTDSNQHRSLRDAFGQFATGVTVVTTRDKQGKPIGLTANSFASVSLEPPLVSWCVDKGSTRFTEFHEAEYFTISVLTAEQQPLSNLFAMRSWDETVFDDVDWFAGHHDVPQFSEVSARFHCRTEHLYEGGDHVIIVGAVLDYESTPHSPLVFFSGQYQALK